MIISARLSDEEEQKLLQILKKNKESIAWSIEELKGISPSICMHKILLEETSKPTVEHQKKAESSNEGSSQEGGTEIAECWFHLCNLR